MKSYTLYRIRETTYANASGVKHEVIEEEYCTNDNGTGIFSDDCLKQITGTGQFCGGIKDLRRYFDDKDTYSGERVFISRPYAERYAKKMNDKYPIERYPVKQFTPGNTALLDHRDRVKIISQNGHDVLVEDLGVDPEMVQRIGKCTFETKDYLLTNQ